MPKTITGFINRRGRIEIIWRNKSTLAICSLVFEMLDLSVCDGRPTFFLGRQNMGGGGPPSQSVSP